MTVCKWQSNFWLGKNDDWWIFNLLLRIWKDLQFSVGHFLFSTSVLSVLCVWYFEPDTQYISFRFAFIWRQFEHINRTSIDRMIEFLWHSCAGYFVAVAVAIAVSVSFLCAYYSTWSCAGQNETTTTISWNTCNKFYANAETDAKYLIA